MRGGKKDPRSLNSTCEDHVVKGRTEKEDGVSGELRISGALVSGGPERGREHPPRASGRCTCPAGLGARCRRRTASRQRGSAHQQAGGKPAGLWHLGGAEGGAAFPSLPLQSATLRGPAWEPAGLGCSSPGSGLAPQLFGRRNLPPCSGVMGWGRKHGAQRAAQGRCWVSGSRRCASRVTWRRGQRGGRTRSDCGAADGAGRASSAQPPRSHLRSEEPAFPALSPLTKGDLPAAPRALVSPPRGARAGIGSWRPAARPPRPARPRRGAGRRRDGPISTSLALCSFRPLSRRRCGGRSRGRVRRRGRRLRWWPWSGGRSRRRP